MTVPKVLTMDTDSNIPITGAITIAEPSFFVFPNNILFRGKWVGI
jgi:hypothetical protein